METIPDCIIELKVLITHGTPNGAPAVLAEKIIHRCMELASADQARIGVLRNLQDDLSALRVASTDQADTKDTILAYTDKLMADLGERNAS